MLPPDEDDDIPTFEDLVEEVVGSTRRTEADEATAETSEDEAVGDEERPAADQPDSMPVGSTWQWVGDADEDTAPPASEPVGEAVTSADAEEEDRPPDRLAGAQFSPGADVGGDASNVLLLGPPRTTTEYELCAKLCGVVGDRPRRRVIVLTGQSPDERLQALREYDEEPFDETVIIVLGERVPATPGKDATAYQVDGETVTVELVRDPLDYTRLGLLINKHLPDRVDEPAPAICVHSLTPLIDLDGPGKLVSFLSVLHGQAEYAGAPVHYHLDPTEVPAANVSELERIVGAAVRFDADGDVSVEM